MGPEMIFALAASWILSWGLLFRLGKRIAGGRNHGPEDVSLIIPARNEAHNLPRLLFSLANQRAVPREIIVVDDGSTDGTAEIAVSHGAKVIRAGPQPSGWKGKTWACHRGAEEARGETLMFLDADAWFEEDGLRPILGSYPGGAFSVLPWHRTGSSAESLSVMFNLLMAVGTIPDGLSGPCLLVGREDYRRAGGHEAVKSDVLETVHLTDHFLRAGVKVGSVRGKGVLTFRMYPEGVRALVRGWMKGFAGGAARTPVWVIALISIWMGGLIVSPIVALVVALVEPLGWLAWIAFAVQFRVLSSMVGRFHWLASLFYPLVVVFYLIVFGASLCGLDKRMKWKGRDLHGA